MARMQGQGENAVPTPVATHTPCLCGGRAGKFPGTRSIPLGSRLVTGTLGPTPTRGPLHPTGHIVPSPSPDKGALTHHSPSCSIFSC